MQWLTILLIGIAANIDNLGISVSYGLKSIKVPFLYNVIISIISMICAFFSIAVGSFLSNYLSQSIANFAGGSLIIGLGVWFIITSPLFTKNDVTRTEITRPVLSNLDKTKTITLKESFFLGFVLSLNCLTIGFGAGITGVPSLFTSISIGVFSLISISIGVMLGNKIGNTIFGNYSNSIAGLLLIVIGIYEIFI